MENPLSISRPERHCKRMTAFPITMTLRLPTPVSSVPDCGMILAGDEIHSPQLLIRFSTSEPRVQARYICFQLNSTVTRKSTGLAATRFKKCANRWVGPRNETKWVHMFRWLSSHHAKPHLGFPNCSRPPRNSKLLPKLGEVVGVGLAIANHASARSCEK